jgi:aminotransferase
MIPRSRPEAEYHDILRALFSRRAQRDAAHHVFSGLLVKCLELESVPVFTVSGRAALYLLFRALDLKRVYMPSYNCWAVLEAARLAGKEVEFFDVDYPRFSIRSDELSRIRRQPGIVVATHQFGFPENVSGIQQQLSETGHVVIEDCAGSMFSRFHGETLGRRGLAAIYSFETTKLWTLFSGGFVVSSDEDLVRRVRNLCASSATPRQGVGDLFRLLLRRAQTEPAVYGMLLSIYLLFREPTEGGRQPSPQLGQEYRGGLSDRQALLGIIMADKSRLIAEHRRRLYDFYSKALVDVPGVAQVEPLPGSLVTPIRFPILVREDRKHDLYQRMRKDGIDLGFSYSYALGEAGRYPGASRFAGESLNLPVHTGVSLTKAQRIIESLRRHTKALGLETGR